MKGEKNMDEMDVMEIGVNDIVRVKGEEWWRSVGGNGWRDKALCIGGVRMYGAHELALGKLMIVREVATDGFYLSECGDRYMSDHGVLFPFEMIEKDLGVVSHSDMLKMREMFGDSFRCANKSENEEKFKRFKNNSCHMLRSQWVWISDDSMPETLCILQSGHEKGSTMTAKVMVLCRNGEKVMARRYRAKDDAEWKWMPNMCCRPLYWLLLPKTPVLEGPFGGEIKDEADSWRTKLTAWLLKIGLIG